MAAIDFPASPTTGQTFTAPNGVIYQWDSVKWVVSFSPTGLVAFRTGTPNNGAYAEWADVKVSWANVQYNNGGGTWSGNDYTVKTAGLYLVTATISMVHPSTGSMYVSQNEAKIRLNGTNVAMGSFNHGIYGGPLPVSCPVSHQAYLAVNDVLNFWISSGYGPPSHMNDASYTWASIVRLGS